jgi:peptidoglycan lytic transglycosylase
MRTFLFTALAVATFGLLTPGPASAAPYWKCMGTGVGCGASDGSRHAGSYKKRGNRHARTNRGARRHARDDSRRGYRKTRRSARHEAPRRKPKRTASVERRASSSVSSSRGSAHSGMASYYGSESGSQTASGQRFNPSAMTAAHRSLPFGTKVRVTNKRNGRSVVVTINDRGPFIRGRIIDLSSGAAGVIGMRSSGVAPVSVEVLGRS